MSLRGVIAKYGKVAQYVRAGAGTYTQGRLVPATPAAAADFVAVIQPVTGRLLDSLPIGQAAEDTRVVYTTTLLTTRGPSNEPDVVLYKSDTWRVFRVDEHDTLSGAPHYVCMIARQTDQAAPV